ncbi:alpha/beta hydrolase [Streptomyces xanthophaeus]|uniref:alpha/beta hydrolase n=1 Tax=Streptomyces xanthophaeus TaxID=67385 RepID=UPI00233F7A09|nr:alpha/beta hydrolase [Streptomyces xanthophaeus]WCD84548.1 2-succinyl-6-hydroxy-2,4-cyclohexadiene-1-carboxylate synthase [Streptomyces xanthophaeus]
MDDTDAVNGRTAADGPGPEGGGERRGDGGVTFVLVHGAGGNSFAWTPLMNELALRGHRAVAVDLPGHGLDAYFPASYQVPQDPERLRTEPSPMGKVTLDDCAEHVTAVVRRAHRNGPVVLVGQSMGGVTLNAVANRVPGLIAHLVYAAAFCPTKRATAQELMTTPEGASSAIFRIPVVPTPPELGVNRVNWRSAEPALFEAVREALGLDRTDEEIRALLNVLEPDESAAIGVTDARGLPQAWGRVPRTYLRFTEDGSIPPALQDLMIAEADEVTPQNPFRVRSLAAPHIGPRDPAVLADELELVAAPHR